MKIVRNLTVAPLRVPLPQGKTLHLGPRKEGRISTHDVDHPGVVRLVEEGKLEIVREAQDAATTRHGRDERGHTDAHGHAPGPPAEEYGDR
jgi:hypothetical protein